MQIYNTIEDAKRRVKQGSRPQEAVEELCQGKSAEFVNRVSEAVNTDLFLDVLNNQDDPSVEFDIVCPKKIISASMAEDYSVKQAGFNDDSFYADLYNENHDDYHVEASIGFSQSMPEGERQMRKLARKRVYEKQAEQAEIDYVKAKDIFTASAVHFSQEMRSLPHEKVASISSDIYTKYGDKCVPLLQKTLHSAGYETIDFIQKKAYYDDGEYAHDMFDAVMRSNDVIPKLYLQKEAFIGKLKRLFSKKKVLTPESETKEKEYKQSLKDYKSAIDARNKLEEKIQKGLQSTSLTDDAKMQKLLDARKIMGERPKEPTKPDVKTILEEQYEAIKKDQDFEEMATQVDQNKLRNILAKKTMEKVGPSVKGGIGSLFGAVATPAAALSRAVKDNLVSSRDIARDLQESIAKSEAKSDQFSSSLSQALKHKNIFENLMDTDEIIAEQDPVVMSQMYESLVNLSPSAAANPEIARAYLRQMSAQEALSPYDALQLVKLEKGLDPSAGGGKSMLFMP